MGLCRSSECTNEMIIIILVLANRKRKYSLIVILADNIIKK